MTTWTFTLLIDLRSKNRVANARDHRLSGAIKKRLRGQWTFAMRIAALAKGMPLFVVGHESSWRPRHVTITRLMGKGQRAFDRNDGMEGGDAATLRDAMQVVIRGGGHAVEGAGIVVKDDERWSTWTYAQERSGDGRPGVRVRVEDVETKEQA